VKVPPGGGVIVGTDVAVPGREVVVGTTSNTFNKGLNKPALVPFLLKVVLFQNEL